jgi:murein DD-endopeptidase MepM/ murein hydrolase activator NlpD
MKFSAFFIISFVIILSLVLYSAATAQADEPYYIVQEGDSLWQIAARFGVTVEELQQANNIGDAGQVVIGARIIIPSLSGVSGQLDTVTVNYGESLRSLSRRYNISEEILAKLNHLASPAEFYAGASLIVSVTENQNLFFADRAGLAPGQSLLELAVLHGESPWSLTLANHLPGTWSALPSDVLQVTSTSQELRPSGLPEAITKVDLDPLQMVQGGTTVIKVYAPPGITMRGSLAERNLNFFSQDYGYVALQGIHAQTPPGLYPLVLAGDLPSGEHFAFSQDVLIQDASFPYDPSLEVDPLTVDPTVTGPESELWASLGVPVTSEKMWNGLFANPVPPELGNCWTSLFGTQRSYNGSAYDFFHGGLDFCGQVGTPLYAVAPGKIVYTGSLTVRGMVTVIDHGWGVYTAYNHQSEILVKPGEFVQSGQLIGLGGATGRTTGPHLHWEVWVGGVQVNPADWLARSFP